MLRFDPEYGRKLCLCDAVAPACSSWFCWPSPGPFPPAPCQASPLRSHPAPHPRDPPPGRVHMTSASRGAFQPVLLQGRSTVSLLLVHGVTPKKYTYGEKGLEIWVWILWWSSCLIIPTSQWAAPVATVKADGYVRISAPCVWRASDNSGNLRS